MVNRNILVACCFLWLIGAGFLLCFTAQALEVTFYSDWFEGKKTASGKVFSQKAFTGASNKYRLGTKLKLSRKGKSVIVVITDTCGNCELDVSKAVFIKLGSLKEGKITCQELVLSK